MKLHIIRHAQAIERLSNLVDEHRHLTCRGRKRFRQVASCLKKMGIDPGCIISSPKVRAVQTAEILSETLHFNGEVLICTDLATGPGLAAISKILREQAVTGELVIIGHEPGLGEVIGELLQISTPCHIPKGGVVSLKISIRQTRLSADLISLITGGGKAITKSGMVMERLTGTKNTGIEEATQ